ncbi:MAG: macro domain-containing protein [Candidatus Hodarchaeales archaeon]
MLGFTTAPLRSPQLQGIDTFMYMIVLVIIPFFTVTALSTFLLHAIKLKWKKPPPLIWYGIFITSVIWCQFIYYPVTYLVPVIYPEMSLASLPYFANVGREIFRITQAIFLVFAYFTVERVIEQKSTKRAILLWRILGISMVVGDVVLLYAAITGASTGIEKLGHRAGGPEILAECKQIRKEQYPSGLPTGEAVATTAGRMPMPAKHVIHTVGPIWQGGNQGEPEKLRNCYLNSLRVAEEKDCQTIAFPAISTGVYGYPRDKAAKVVSKALKDYFTSVKPDVQVKKVYLVFFSPADLDVFLSNNEF